MANTTIGTLAISVKANVDKAVKDFRKTGKEVTKLQKIVSNAKIGFTKLSIAVAGAGLTFEKLRREVVQSMRDIDSLAKTASKLGIATEQLGGLQLAAELSGISIGQMETAVQRMVRRVAEAAKGTGEAKNALAELNLNAQALIGLSPDRQLYEIADAFQAVNSQSDRVRLAFKLFDTEGVALVNTLAGGSEALKAIQRDAQRLGFLISAEDVRRIEQANDAITRMNFATRALFNEIAIEIAPEIEDLFNRATARLAAFNQEVQSGSSFLGDLGDRVKGIGDDIDTGVTATLKLNDALSLVIGSLRLASDGAASLIRSMVRTGVNDFHQVTRDHFGGRKELGTIDRFGLSMIDARDAERISMIEGVVNSFNRLFGTGPDPVDFSGPMEAFNDYLAEQEALRNAEKIATEQATQAILKHNAAIEDQIYLALEQKKIDEQARIAKVKDRVKSLERTLQELLLTERQLLRADLSSLSATREQTERAFMLFDAIKTIEQQDKQAENIAAIFENLNNSLDATTFSPLQQLFDSIIDAGGSFDDLIKAGEIWSQTQDATLAKDLDRMADTLKASLETPAEALENFLMQLDELGDRLTAFQKDQLISNKYDELFGDTFKQSTPQSPAALQQGTAEARSAEIAALNRFNNGSEDKRYQDKMIKLSQRSRDYLRDIADDIRDIERREGIEVVG